MFQWMYNHSACSWKNRPYTPIIEKKKCRYMSPVRYLGWYLCLSYKASVNISEVMIEMKQYKNRRDFSPV